MPSRLGAVKALVHTTVFHGGAAGKTTLPEQSVPLQFGRSRLTDVLAEYRAATASVVILGLAGSAQCWRGARNNER
jgi:hypothetical protein